MVSRQPGNWVPMAQPHLSDIELTSLTLESTLMRLMQLGLALLLLLLPAALSQASCRLKPDHFRVRKPPP